MLKRWLTELQWAVLCFLWARERKRYREKMLGSTSSHGKTIYWTRP